MPRSTSITILLLLFFTASGFSRSRTVMVIAHRGAHNQYPENTIPAFKAAIEMGADYFECDVRTTADGTLVIMHNGTVNATTNGQGAVRRMTFKQIEALDVGVKFSPEFAGTRVPTFEQTLKLARGKIGVYVDAKDTSRNFAEAVVNDLKQFRMVPHSVVYGYSLSFFRDVVQFDPNIRIMPEAVNQTLLHTLVGEFHPQVIAFDASDFKPPLISITQQAGAKIFVDRLGSADNPEAWQAAIDLGADGIQTNYPAKLLGYLRAHGYHR
ncbi:MAG: glycerophosphodiester phosphodiesterase [Terriglobia bacterium]